MRIETRRKTVYALVLVLLAALVYINSLGNGFVYDDPNQLVKNPWIRDFRNIPAVLTHEVWGFQPAVKSSFYRPTMHLLNMLIYPFSGLNPLGYHIANLLLHSANSLLVFLLAMALFEDIVAALAAGVLFAVHPVHTEAVDWIGGSPDLMLVFFSLVAMLLFAARKNPVLQGVFFLLAMLSKEPAVTLVFILPVFACALDAGDAGPVLKARNAPPWYFRFLPVVAAALVYFAMRIYALGGLTTGNNHPEMGLLFEAANAPYLFARYMAKLVLPLNLNLAYNFHPVRSMLSPRAIAGFLAAFAFAGLLAISFRKNRKVFFALCLLAVPVLPALYFAPLGDLVFGERYLYLPSVGFALAAGWAFEYFHKKAKHVSVAAGIMVAAIFAFGTMHRAPVWKSNFSLWSDAVKKSPTGYVPLVNLGVEYGNMGDSGQAIALFEKAASINPARYEAYLLEGQTYQMIKKYTLAGKAYQMALKADPRHSETYLRLAMMYRAAGEPDKAIQTYLALVSVYPDSMAAYTGLGQLYFSARDYKNAAEALANIARLAPGSPDAHYNLAQALRLEGDMKSAAQQYQAAIRLDPGFTKAYAGLGEAMRGGGK